MYTQWLGVSLDPFLYGHNCVNTVLWTEATCCVTNRIHTCRDGGDGKLTPWVSSPYSGTFLWWREPVLSCSFGLSQVTDCCSSPSGALLQRHTHKGRY